MKLKISHTLLILGAATTAQSNAQLSLQSFFETQGFADSQSVNGTYDLSAYSPGLFLTVGGDGIYKVANANRGPIFGLWGPGDMTFNFSETIDVNYVVDGRNRPGELNSWTGAGQLINTFADSSAYTITPNSYENITANFLIEGDTTVEYLGTNGFTVALDGDPNQPIDLVTDLTLVNIPEPSSLLLLGLGGLGFSTRRKR